jgi:hypothetical protein
VSSLFSQLYVTLVKENGKGEEGERERERRADGSYAGWIGTVGAAHEGVPHPTLEDAATRLAAIAGTSTCHIAQSKEGILVPGVVRLHFYILIPEIRPRPLIRIVCSSRSAQRSCHISPLAPLEARLTTSGDHTETQSSQDYG